MSLFDVLLIFLRKISKFIYKWNNLQFLDLEKKILLWLWIYISPKGPAIWIYIKIVQFISFNLTELLHLI